MHKFRFHKQMRQIHLVVLLMKFLYTIGTVCDIWRLVFLALRETVFKHKPARTAFQAEETRIACRSRKGMLQQRHKAVTTEVALSVRQPVITGFVTFWSFLKTDERFTAKAATLLIKESVVTWKAAFWSRTFAKKMASKIALLRLTGKQILFMVP